MSGSAAMSSTLNPSGTYICASVRSAAVFGSPDTGFGFKCRRTGLD
jgi:hypothetical protein